MAAVRPLPSDATFAAFRADEAAEQAARKAARLHMRKPRRYPGRNRIMARQDAADLAMRQFIEGQGDGLSDRYACTDPFMIHALGLPSAHDAVPRYFEGKSNSKVPVSLESRCRKCKNCLAHRRRLWTARASDELKAAHRTWFATLTVRPDERFVATMQASALAASAGHGTWASMSSENQFRYLVKFLGGEIDKFLKRVRKSGAAFRYLLVSEAHKDGFPHFHLLIHEAALPLTKRLLESNWRLGYSQFRLVNNSDPRSAFYVCKYLAKSALTRVRASKRYGRDQLVSAGTEAVKSLLTRIEDTVKTGPVPGAPGEVIVEPGCGTTERVGSCELYSAERQADG